METTELINELRAEIAALSLRVEQLEKQMAETQLLDFDAEELAPEAEPAAEAEPAEAPEVMPAAEEPKAEEPAPDAEPAAEEPAPEAEPAEAVEPSVLEEPAEAPIWDLDISLEGPGVNPLPDLHSFQWMMDIPGGEVANLISGISLNDRVLFINTLFREDPKLFQKTVTQLNAMASLEDAVSFLVNHFPEWNLSSELVYRFMMAVRRKLK